MRKIMFRLACAMMIVIANSLPASALLGSTIGVGARAISMGEAFVAVADDFSATYYNPAGLGQIKDTLKFNIDWISPTHQFEVTSLSTGEDITGAKENPQFEPGTQWNPTKTADLHDLDDIHHNLPTIGLTANLTKIFSALHIPVNLTLGVVLMIPNNVGQIMVITDFIPDIPKFTQFGDMNEQLFIAFSLGIEVMRDRLYLGLGSQIGLYGDGDVHNNSGAVLLQGYEDMTESDQQTFVFQMQEDWHVLAKLNPIAGILYTPFDKKLKIGASYKAKSEMSLGPSPLVMNYLSSTTDQSSRTSWNGMLDFYFGFAPEEWSMGIAYEFNVFTVSVDLELQKWSDFGWSIIFTEVYFNTTSPVQGYLPPDPDFDDVINTRLGAEYRPTEKLKITAGYQHAPTPVPDQSGRVTNYLDMDKDIFSIGASYEIIKNYIKVGGVFQYMLCEDYKVYKEGVVGVSWQNQESYEVKGDVYLLGLSAEINF